MNQKPTDQGSASSHEGLPDDIAALAAENAAEPGVTPAADLGATQAASSGEPDPFKVLEALNAENADLKDKLLRALADVENMRRRAAKDVADARAYGMTNFARDMLTVADNMHRALTSVPDEARASADGALKALIEGIELTERDLAKTLERHGVKRLDPQDQKFDPHLHQAMFEVEDPSKPSGTVVQVMQAGYVIGERVLRPAMVGVSKGGPKAAAANDAA